MTTYPASMRLDRINAILYGEVDLTTIGDGELLFLLDYPQVQLPDRRRLDVESERRWPAGRPDVTLDNTDAR